MNGRIAKRRFDDVVAQLTEAGKVETFMKIDTAPWRLLATVEDRSRSFGRASKARL